jgi:hypothetical protein
MLDRCDLVCNTALEREDAELAHVWAVSNQAKFGNWGRDANNDVHLLCKKCHRIVDSLL